MACFYYSVFLTVVRMTRLDEGVPAERHAVRMIPRNLRPPPRHYLIGPFHSFTTCEWIITLWVFFPAEEWTGQYVSKRISYNDGRPKILLYKAVRSGKAYNTLSVSNAECWCHTYIRIILITQGVKSHIYEECDVIAVNNDALAL